MVDGPHHSIGEVLSLLKAEYADVTISKIRFLESQGLIEPERTPSGYRKFYKDDIDRLRWILTQQRDNFLPLKVIKRRLAEEGFDPVAEVGERPATSTIPEPSLFAQRDDEHEVDDPPDAVEGLPPGVETDAGSGRGSEAGPSPAEAALDPSPAPAEPSPSAMLGSVSLTPAELAEAAAADLGLVADLEKSGLIEALVDDAGSVFDHEALLVTKAAVALRDAGMEVRHLRMYKVAAEREAGLLHQMRASALAKGGPAAAAAMVELADLRAQGEAIRGSIVRRALGLDLEH